MAGWIIKRIAVCLLILVLGFGYLLYDSLQCMASFTHTLALLETEQVKQKDKLSSMLLDQKKKELSTSRTSVRQTMMMDISAYTCMDDHKRPGDPAYCQTADGTYLKQSHRRKVVAADPNVFHAGTRLMVEGIGEVTVRDKGGAIKGMRLDLFWDETDRLGALRFGRQMKKVTVLN